MNHYFALHSDKKTIGGYHDSPNFNNFCENTTLQTDYKFCKKTTPQTDQLFLQKKKTTAQKPKKFYCWPS